MILPREPAHRPHSFDLPADGAATSAPAAGDRKQGAVVGLECPCGASIVRLVNTFDVPG